MRLSEATTAVVEREIKRLQDQQKRYSPRTHTSKGIGKLLAPLFAEMALRQKEGRLG